MLHFKLISRMFQKIKSLRRLTIPPYEVKSVDMQWFSTELPILTAKESEFELNY